jgi:hypothetical protein
LHSILKVYIRNLFFVKLNKRQARTFQFSSGRLRRLFVLEGEEDGSDAVAAIFFTLKH